MESIKSELKLLEQLEKEQPINWGVDFWKMTTEVHQKLQEIVNRWKANNGRQKIVQLPEGFKDGMIEQIRYYDKHKVKIDGTVPTDRELERIANNGML